MTGSLLDYLLENDTDGRWHRMKWFIDLDEAAGLTWQVFLDEELMSESNGTVGSWGHADAIRRDAADAMNRDVADFEVRPLGEQAGARTWNVGDPEPTDGPWALDSNGQLWVPVDGGWYASFLCGTQPQSWELVLSNVGPLREVRRG